MGSLSPLTTPRSLPHFTEEVEEAAGRSFSQDRPWTWGLHNSPTDPTERHVSGARITSDRPGFESRPQGPSP